MDDEEVNVDDLFDDEDLEQAALNIPLPANDVVESSLHSVTLDSKLRLDELHANGCRQRVVWSRMGCVASLSEDSSSISIQCLRLNRRTAAWELSAKYQLDLVTDDVVPHEYTHLCWSSTGTDLAIVDTRGRVLAFGMSTASAANRFQDLNFVNTDQGDDLRRAVGVFWLPANDRTSPAVTQLSKQDNQWVPAMTARKPIGPFWPRAFVVVTRLGDLRLIYMKPNRSWAEESTALTTPSSTKDLLTHAAFASTVDGSIFLSTHSADGCLSFYLVHVNRPDLFQDSQTLAPITLTVEHVKDNVYNGGSTKSSAEGDLLNGTSNTSHDISCLSHLEIVPTTDMEKAVQMPSTVFAVKTAFGTIPGISNSLQPKSSTIHRWSLYAISQTLHPRFDDIPTKGTSPTHTTPQSYQTLQRLPDIAFDGIIASIHLVDNASALAITTLDGTTTFYNPNTMSPIFYESSTQEVTSLSQSGFAFPPTPTPFTICFSPSACCALSLPEGKATLSSMSHHSTLQDATDNNLDSALSALILTYTRACYNGASTDDILTCILSTVRPTHIPQLATMMLSVLFRDGDFLREGEAGTELGKIAQKLLVPKCMSLFAALGAEQHLEDKGRMKRNTAGRYAWMTLQVRNVAMQLFYVMNTSKMPERLPGEIVALTIESIAWAGALFRFIVDELCAIDDGEEAVGEERVLCELLLKGVWSRYFMKMIEKVWRMFANPQTRTLQEILRAVKEQQGLGLTLAGLGTLLEAAERFSNVTGPVEERELIACGEIKQTGLLEQIVKEVLPGMRRSGDVDKLAIYTSGMVRKLDWTLLEERDVDVHRKTKVKGRGEVRRCVRCASISEDIGGPKREWPKWIQQQMMRCVCEASFWVEGLDD